MNDEITTITMIVSPPPMRWMDAFGPHRDHTIHIRKNSSDFIFYYYCVLYPTLNSYCYTSRRLICIISMIFVGECYQPYSLCPGRCAANKWKRIKPVSMHMHSRTSTRLVRMFAKRSQSCTQHGSNKDQIPTNKR